MDVESRDRRILEMQESLRKYAETHGGFQSQSEFAPKGEVQEMPPSINSIEDSLDEALPSGKEEFVDLSIPGLEKARVGEFESLEDPVFVSPRFPENDLPDMRQDFADKENCPPNVQPAKAQLTNLQARIEVKDALIAEMTSLQQDLYKNLEDCQLQISDLKQAKIREAQSFQTKIRELDRQNEELRKLITAKQEETEAENLQKENARLSAKLKSLTLKYENSAKDFEALATNLRQQIATKDMEIRELSQSKREIAPPTQDRFTCLMQALKGSESKSARLSQTPNARVNRTVVSDSSRQTSNLKSLLDDIMTQLRVLSCDDIAPALRKLRKAADSIKPLKKFATRMTEVVVASAPPYSYRSDKPPSLRHTWKFFKRMANARNGDVI